MSASRFMASPLVSSLVIALSTFACHAPAGTEAGAGKGGTGLGSDQASTIARAVTLSHRESFSLCPDGSYESGLNLFDDAKSWQAFVKAASARAPQLADWKPNFAQSRVAVFRLGSKPSAGYTVRVLDATLRGADGELLLTLQSIKPAPGAMTASMITAPCAVVSINLSVFKALSVLDASDGTLLGKIQH
jgi:PrcB C-terminal